jgi:hypothetical protein
VPTVNRFRNQYWGRAQLIDLLGYRPILKLSRCDSTTRRDVGLLGNFARFKPRAFLDSIVVLFGPHRGA